jgi:rhomboid family GlyGly-CTERM serine protease
LLSGHIVHLNWSHWLLNMAGLAIVAFFFSSHASLKQWLLVILVSVVIISAGIWWWITDINYYVGLSGVLHGLFLYGALREIRFYPISGYVLTAVLLAKLLWEFFNGALPGSEDMAGGRVLTEAHLLGASGGILIWVIEVIKSRFDSKSV